MCEQHGRGAQPTQVQTTGADGLVEKVADDGAKRTRQDKRSPEGTHAREMLLR